MSAFTQSTPEPVPPTGKSPLASAPEPPRRLSFWKIGAIIVLSAVVLWGGYSLLRQPAQAAKQAPVVTIRTARIATGFLERTVRVSGQTSARNYASITVPAFRGPDSRRDLTLQKLAKGGAWVKKGDVIAELDPTAAKDHIDDQGDVVLQAENDIKKRQFEQEVELVNLQQSILVAQSDRDKKKLDASAAEVKTIIERELLQLDAEEAEAKYKEQIQTLPIRKTAQAAELRILDITRIRQTTHRDRHVADLEKFVIRAPMSGLVVVQQVFRGGEMGQIQQGDQVSPGQLILKIVDPGSMQIEGSVNQAESSEFRVGQSASIGLDAFPDLRFKGKVYSMGALAAAGGRSAYYVRTLPIRIAIEGSDPRLIPDLSAWGNVRIESTDNSPLVPLAAIFDDGDKTVVYVKNGLKFEKRAVETGVQNQTHAAVVSGLRGGEDVALEIPK